MLVDTSLSELNDVVRNLELETRQSVVNEIKERDIRLDDDFIKRIVDVRMQNSDRQTRINNKLDDIRQFYKNRINNNDI